ncbi:MAG: hypothetical protein ACFB21_00885 [Opitutales bacterium]
MSSALDVTPGERRARILLDSRSMPKRREGEKLDYNIAGLVVGTLQRTANAISDKLDLGPVTAIRAMGRGECTRVVFGAEEITFDWFRNISSWVDIEPSLEHPTDVLPDYPVLPSPPEIRRLLEAETACRSCSFQRLASGNWEHFTFDETLQILPLESAAMMMLQIDILCREQGYPRGRFHLQWASGGIWFWISEIENLMMVLEPSEISPHELQLLIRCGDAFLLS